MKPPVQKFVVVAYEVWSFMRASNYRDLTGNILVFWISGRLWEVIAHGDLHETNSFCRKLSP